MAKGWNDNIHDNASGDLTFLFFCSRGFASIKYFKVVDNHVVKYTPPEEYEPAMKPAVKPKTKLGCLLVGAESTDPSYLTKEYCGIFKESGVMPKKLLSRFLVSSAGYIPPGTPINASHFRVGDYVDVRGKT